MDRLTFFKYSVAAGSGHVLAPLFGTKKLENRETVDGNIIALQIGDLETYILSDGEVIVDQFQPIFAPEITPDLVQQELEKLHLPLDKIRGAINVMLIKKEGRLILLDSGAGYHFGQNAGKLVGELSNMGIERQDITDIVITHAHIDHIGGIINSEGGFVYPNATYHIAEKELNFWLAEDPDFSKSKGKEGSESSILFARTVLKKMLSKLVTFQYGEVLFSCMYAELAAGHTPGHTIFKIFSGAHHLKHVVDSFHTALLVSHPEWGTQWDIDFELGIKTRKRLIEEGSRDRTVFMCCHMPWPGLGYIDKIASNYFWSIYPYYNPGRIIL